MNGKSDAGPHLLTHRAGQHLDGRVVTEFLGESHLIATLEGGLGVRIAKIRPSRNDDLRGPLRAIAIGAWRARIQRNMSTTADDGAVLPDLASSGSMLCTSSTNASGKVAP